jgi:histone acetyltransferase (RNA polymerase elongator complex component)
MSKSHYIIPIFVPHEGCPHDCVFCNQNSITGSTTTVTAKTVESTIQEYLKTINNSNAVVEVSFYGGTFTAINIKKQIELLSVAKKYKDNKLIDYIHLSTRPDYINEEILLNLKNYSVDIIELGVQSLNDEVLLKSGRGHTAEDVYKASALIKEYGFILGHQIMLGLPGDDFKKDIDTAKKIIDMKPTIARIYPSLVVKNTPMENMYNKKVYNPYTLEDAIYISKIIYAMFVSNNINVIRIGLQPTDEINYGKDLIAGPFHPAFRELVEGSIYCDIISECMGNYCNAEIELYINSKDISKLYANKKKFFNDMKRQITPKILLVKQSNSITRNSFMLKSKGKCIIINVMEYLQIKYKEGYLDII